jgi:hypothetical protein
MRWIPTFLFSFIFKKGIHLDQFGLTNLRKCQNLPAPPLLTGQSITGATNIAEFVEIAE